MMRSFLDFSGLLFLGESNHGLYFRAHPPARLGVDADVVIKVLVRDASDEQWKSVAREIRLLHSLDSEWVVKLYEAGHDDGRLYYAMEYAVMGTLARPGRPLSVHEKVRALSHGARGLHLLHQQGIVHRDIKPAKVLVHESGGKLNDLGIADDTLDRPAAAIPTGSIGFMAPEVARGEHATPASDIFGLGATLHLLLTGTSIYASVPRDDLLSAVQHVAEIPPTLSVDDVPPLLRALMESCLQLEPADRVESAAEVGECLDEALVSELPPM